MTPEDRLHKRLRDTHKIKDNNSAVRNVFGSFADYYGEKADEDRVAAKRTLVMIGAMVVILFMFLFSCMC